MYMYITNVSFFSTSPELSNKQRFEYFTRTIPSDHHQVKAMVAIVKRLGWSYVSIIYEESNYGIKIITFKKKIMVRSYDFKSIVDTLGFVDKSSLIKEVLKGNPFKVITAPRRFGKSSNLDMLRTFLTLPVEPLVGIRLQTIVSENLELFKNLKIYQDDPDFVLNTLGTFPVINVDFSTKKPIGTKKDCVEILSFKIHQSFLSHKYLCSSGQLSEREKSECKTWCSESYKIQREEDIIEGLARLAAFLHKHHDHTVITLIDDFDSLVTAASFTAPDADLRSVVCFIMEILSTLINKNQRKCRAIITGSSILPTLGTPKLERFAFLGNHSLGGFHGFTEDEVDHLLDNPEFHLDTEEIRRAYKMYRGYNTKRGTVLYCTHSFLRFLLIGKAKPYWEPSVYVESLMNAYSIPSVEETIDSLLKDKSIGILLPEKLKLAEYLSIRKIAIKKCSIEPPNLVLFLMHLLELGYLTYYLPKVAQNQAETYLRLPNGEIKSVILEYLWNIQVFSNLSNGIGDENNEDMVENVEEYEASTEN